MAQKIKYQARKRKVRIDTEVYDLLGVGEVADILQVSRWTVYRLVKDGKLRSHDPEHVRIHPLDLVDYIEGMNAA